MHDIPEVWYANDRLCKLQGRTLSQGKSCVAVNNEVNTKANMDIQQPPSSQRLAAPNQSPICLDNRPQQHRPTAEREFFADR